MRNIRDIAAGLGYDPENLTVEQYTEALNIFKGGEPPEVTQSKEDIRTNADLVVMQSEDINNELIKLNTDVSNAANQMESISIMSQLLDGGVETGWGKEWALEAQGAAKALFGYDVDLTKEQVFNAVGQTLALNQLTKLSGAASDKDIDFVKSGAPSINKSTGANRLLLDFARFYNHKIMRRSAFASEWATEHKGKKEYTLANYNKAIAEWNNKPENLYNLEDKFKNLTLNSDSLSVNDAFINASDALDARINEFKKNIGAQ
jgi:hypothetical protein